MKRLPKAGETSKIPSRAPRRGIIIFTSAFLAVSAMACSSSRENVKGGDSVAEKILVEKEELTKSQTVKKYDIKDIVPKKTDTLVVSEKAMAQIKKKISELDMEEKKMKMPSDGENLKEREMLYIKEHLLNGLQWELYKAAEKGDAKSVAEIVERIKGPAKADGTKSWVEYWGEQERAERVVNEFYQIINLK